MKTLTALPILPEATRSLVQIRPLLGRSKMGGLLDLSADFMHTKRKPYSLDAVIELAERFRSQHPELIIGWSARP